MSRSIYVLSIPKFVPINDFLPFVEQWKKDYTAEFGPLVVLMDSIHLIRLDETGLKMCKNKDELLELIKEREDKQCVELVGTSQESPVQKG